MMQVQPMSGLWDLIFFWLFSGSSLLGLPPGDRDPALIKAAPAGSLAYFEWTSQGRGQAGASGIDGFVADPEILRFFELFNEAVAKRDTQEADDFRQEFQRQLPMLIKLISAHPGCAFVAYEPPVNDKRGPAVIVERITGLRAGIVLASGNDTEELWGTFNRLFESIPGYQREETSGTQSIPLAIPGLKGIMRRAGQRIVFALGNGQLDKALDGLLGNSLGLDTNPRFQQALQRISVPRVSTIGWVDGQATVACVTDILGPVGNLVRPMLSMIGVDALDHVIQVAGVDQGTMVQRTFIATGGRTDGLLSLVSGKPLGPAQFAHVPADCDLVFATSLSLKNVYQEARRVLTLVQPLSVRLFDETIKHLESELELKIVDDVLPAFGDAIVVFDSPANGGMIATSLMASIEIEHQQRAARVFDQVMKLIDQSLSNEHEDGQDFEKSSLRQQPFLDHVIYYVHSDGRGFAAEPSVVPTFCLTDRHLLFAVHPQAMKAQLRYMSAKSPSFVPPVARANALPPGDALSYAYLNGTRTHGIMAAALPYLSSAWLGKLELDGILLDAFSIPSAAAIIPYFGDTQFTLTRQPDGLLLEALNIPPVTVSIALLSAYRAWHNPSNDFFDDARRKQRNAIKQARHGEDGGGVVSALGEATPTDGTEPAEKTDKPVAPNDKGSSARKLAPIVIKSLVPEGMQSLIPDSALKRLEEGPTPEQIQRREEAKQKRDERRRRRLESKQP